MTAYVFFMIFCSLIGVAVGAIAVFGIFAIRRAIRNKKQEKESENHKKHICRHAFASF